MNTPLCIVYMVTGMTFVAEIILHVFDAINCCIGIVLPMYNTLGEIAHIFIAENKHVFVAVIMQHWYLLSQKLTLSIKWVAVCNQYLQHACTGAGCSLGRLLSVAGVAGWWRESRESSGLLSGTHNPVNSQN